MMTEHQQEVFGEYVNVLLVAYSGSIEPRELPDDTKTELVTNAINRVSRLIQKYCSDSHCPGDRQKLITHLLRNALAIANGEQQL